MSNHKKTVLRFSDKQLIVLFGKLSEELGSIANYSIDGISGQIGSDDERLKQFLAADVSVISAARISGVGFSVSFQATDPDKQPYYSVISINTNDGYNADPKPDAESIGRCHLIIGKFIKRQNLDPGILGRTPGPILEPHVALLSKIESSAAEQIEKTNEFVQEITSRFDIRGQELEARYAARRQKLEDEIAAKEAVIHADQQRLEERKKELDDRTNTHARRAIREDLVRVLRERQSQFTVSDKTRGLRAPVHIVFVTLLASTLVGALWSLYVWGSYANDSWGAMTITSAVKTAIFSFGFLTSAGLYISWMTRWSDKHADSQFQLAQFEIDINRASWAVEAALEWKGAQGEQMPEALLAGITKHLFEASKQENTDYSPLEALASSILGSASNLKLNMNGSEVAYDRKSMKELKSASN